MTFTLKVVTLYLVISVSFCQILLYNTENQLVTEKFDCIYHIANDGEEISYCRRPGGNLTVDRHRSDCDNQGQKKYVRDLLRDNIEPAELLTWNSGVEMADLYAGLFYNRSLLAESHDQFLCQCTKLGTFGKYCEYQQTHHASTFDQTIKAQFSQK
jgi:hypothetical protein